MGGEWVRVRVRVKTRVTCPFTHSPTRADPDVDVEAVRLLQPLASVTMTTTCCWAPRANAGAGHSVFLHRHPPQDRFTTES